MIFILKLRKAHYEVCSFGHVHSKLIARMNTPVHGIVLSLSYHAIVIFNN